MINKQKNKLNIHHFLFFNRIQSFKYCTIFKFLIFLINYDKNFEKPKICERVRFQISIIITYKNMTKINNI
jgi:hypothetical protein